MAQEKQPPPDTWAWDASRGVYYHAQSNMYAVPGTGGEWAYLKPDELAARGASAGYCSNGPHGGPSESQPARPGPSDEREEGEVVDDVGWGGLMDPETLSRVVKEKETYSSGRDGRHPAYGGSSSSRENPHDGEDRTRRHQVYGNSSGYPHAEQTSSSLGRDRPPAACPSDRTSYSSERTSDPYGRTGSDAYSVERPREPDRYGDHRIYAYDRDAPATDGPSNADDGKEPPDPSAHLLRLVVKRSKDLSPGSVALLDARDGGIQIGRDRPDRGQARLRVREMEVSKVHAVVYWGLGGADGEEGGGEEGEEEEGWWVVDLGSTLGTYVARRGDPEAVRLSEPKAASKPFALRHLSVLTVGTTTFVVHIHDDWPCEACQVGGNAQISVDADADADAGKDGAGSAGEAPGPAPLIALDAAQSRGNRRFKRDREMAALRDSLLGKTDGPRGGAPDGTYIDRSAQRRKLHRTFSPPRRRPPPETAAAPGVVSAPPQPAGPSSASRAMLAKHGWSEGTGLGRDGAGRVEPVAAVLRNDRVGLGARGQIADPGDGADAGTTWRDRAKQRRWDEVARG